MFKSISAILMALFLFSFSPATAQDCAYNHMGAGATVVDATPERATVRLLIDNPINRHPRIGDTYIRLDYVLTRSLTAPADASAFQEGYTTVTTEADRVNISTLVTDVNVRRPYGYKNRIIYRYYMVHVTGACAGQISEIWYGSVDMSYSPGVE